MPGVETILGIEVGSGIIMRATILDWIEQAKHEFRRADEGQNTFFALLE